MMQDEEYNLREQLDRYIAGELKDSEIEELTRRIVEDPALQSAMDEYDLTRYIDGGMSPEEAEEFVSRINSNPQLQEAMAEYRSLEWAFERLRDREPDVDYARQREEILAGIELNVARRRKRRVILQAVVSVAAAAAIVIFTILLMPVEKVPVEAPGGEVVSILEPSPSEAYTGEVAVDLIEQPDYRDQPPDAGSFLALVVPGGRQPWIDGHLMMLIGG